MNTRDSVGQYLREVGEFDLLTSEEEAELARRIRAGCAESLNELVARNLRFVVSIAKRYDNRGVPLGDLIGEGNLGLIDAARRFDPDQGVRFTSYAVSWVKHAVLIALARHGRSVRVPLNRLADLGKMKRAEAVLRTELGREPTMPELALKTGLSKKVILALQGVERAELRLDAPGSGDSGETVDLSADDETGVEAETDHTFLGTEIDQALGSLTPRERRVLSLHFGLGGEHEHTLEEISSVFGLTRERIRQIRERALMTLRRGKFADRLASFA